MELNFKSLTEEIESQHTEMKTLFLGLSKFVVESLQYNVSRDKINELQTLVDCLAQSSISPDLLKDIDTALSVLVKNSMPHSDSSTLVIRLKLTEICKKVQETEELCKSVNDILISFGKSTDLQNLLEVIKTFQKGNENVMKNILQKLQILSPRAGNSTSSL